jgi:hypothetical protein
MGSENGRESTVMTGDAPPSRADGYGLVPPGWDENGQPFFAEGLSGVQWGRALCKLSAASFSI